MQSNERKRDLSDGETSAGKRQKPETEKSETEASQPAETGQIKYGYLISREFYGPHISEQVNEILAMYTSLETVNATLKCFSEVPELVDFAWVEEVGSLGEFTMHGTNPTTKNMIVFFVSVVPLNPTTVNVPLPNGFLRDQEVQEEGNDGGGAQAETGRKDTSSAQASALN
ncbi:hypothetical protein FKW77_007625 [Venturia effusa]|uniref:Uncharacterized protein n=1 Tax=Venturia effusa TaxID=50376 RepID=A0A517LLU6_9PEZI|nr:hypothetical protein FKW77_007625 [Venturia effusa]